MSKKRHQVKVKTPFKTLGGYKISTTRTAKTPENIKRFIAANKAAVEEFIKRREVIIGAKIPADRVEQYIKNQLKSYKSFEDFIKKAAAPIEWQQGAHAYDLLVETGRLEDLQAEVNETVTIERIHYIGNGHYEYIGDTRKCKFTIYYVSGDNSQVTIEIENGEDK